MRGDGGIKPRTPLTPEDAMTAANGFLSVDSIVDAFKRTFDKVSESTLRKWADPDQPDYRVPVAAALRIDDLCADKGFPRPFAALFSAHAAKGEKSTGESPSEAMMRTVQELGDVSRVLNAALAAVGPGGVGLTAAEYRDLAIEVGQASQALNAVLVAAAARLADGGGR